MTEKLLSLGFIIDAIVTHSLVWDNAVYFRPTLENIFVSPYPALFLRCGWVGWNIILFLFSRVLYRLKFVLSCSNIAKT